MLQNIKALLEKDLVFVWTSECENEFCELKKVISGPLGLQQFVPGWDI